MSLGIISVFVMELMGFRFWSDFFVDLVELELYFIVFDVTIIVFVEVVDKLGGVSAIVRFINVLGERIGQVLTKCWDVGEF